MLALILLAAAQPDCETTVNQGEMNECALIAYRAADAALNRQWAITLAAVRRRDQSDTAPIGMGSGPAEPRLRDAQRAWIVYRDSHCDSRYPYGSTGQLDYMMNVSCLTQLTLARTEQLEQIAGN